MRRVGRFRRIFGCFTIFRLEWETAKCGRRRRMRASTTSGSVIAGLVVVGGRNCLANNFRDVVLEADFGETFMIHDNSRATNANEHPHRRIGQRHGKSVAQKHRRHAAKRKVPAQRVLRGWADSSSSSVYHNDKMCACRKTCRLWWKWSESSERIEQILPP